MLKLLLRLTRWYDPQEVAQRHRRTEAVRNRAILSRISSEEVHSDLTATVSRSRILRTAAERAGHRLG